MGSKKSILISTPSSSPLICYKFLLAEQVYAWPCVSVPNKCPKFCRLLIGQGPTNRNQCSYSTIVHSTLFLTPLASGARVGARVEVKKNDLGKVSRIFSLRSKSMLDPVCLSSVFWRRHTSCSYNVPAPFTLSPLDCWRTSNAGTWLSNATLRYLSLAERCHTQEFFILLKNEKNPKNEVKFEYFPDQFCAPPHIFS